MDKDTREELDRLEKELLTEQPTAEEISEEDLLKELDLEGIFDEEIELSETPDDDTISINNTNDYSDELQAFADNGGEEPEKNYYGNKLTLGLMITVCALCLGIIGVLIYWLAAFL